MIRVPSEPYDKQGAQYVLQTYYSYVRAWIEKIENLYGSITDYEALRNAGLQIKSTAKLQGGTTASPKLIASYSRGRLTLKAMRSFPINENEHLASTANLWLPVQAYYALHGVGLAVMISLGQNEPKDHRTFRASFTDLASRHLPPPFNAQCCSGPSKQNFTFQSLNTSSKEVIAYSSLSNPKYSDNLTVLSVNV